jgi:hypothetical protein
MEFRLRCNNLQADGGAKTHGMDADILQLRGGEELLVGPCLVVAAATIFCCWLLLLLVLLTAVGC